jgi:DNA-binding NtrC family response regulator
MTLKTREHQKSNDERIVVLGIVSGPQGAELERILSHTRWQFRQARSIKEAIRALRCNATPVIVCDSDLADGTWRDLMRHIETMHPQPQTIVLAHSADVSLWAEVLSQGGFDLLVTPLRPREVYDVIPMAWRHWNDLAKQLNAGCAHSEDLAFACRAR